MIKFEERIYYIAAYIQHFLQKKSTDRFNQIKYLKSITLQAKLVWLVLKLSSILKSMHLNIQNVYGNRG